MAELAGAGVMMVAGLAFLGVSKLGFLIARQNDPGDGRERKLWFIPLRGKSVALRNRVAASGALVMSAGMFVYAAFLVVAAIAGWDVVH